MRTTAFAIFTAALAACGTDDDGGSDDAIVSATQGETTGEASTSTGGVDESSTTGPAETTTGTGGSTTAGAESTSTSGGGPTDPSYPPDADGTCPNGTAPIQLSGASLCAPFCAGADARCPAPASGDATPQCTPFEMDGGSGTACTTHDDCPMDEACGMNDTCVAVAFWACRLLCDAGQTCSDGMVCAGDACGYP